MSANASEPTLHDLENTGTALEDYGRIKNQRREQQIQTAKNGDVKQRLEQKRRDASRTTIRVMGEPVEFVRPGVGEMRDAMRLRNRALVDDDPEAEEELFDFVFEFLAEQSVRNDLDEEWWGGFGPEVLMGVFEDLAAGGLDDQTRQEVERFREE